MSKCNMPELAKDYFPPAVLSRSGTNSDTMTNANKNTKTNNMIEELDKVIKNTRRIHKKTYI